MSNEEYCELLEETFTHAVNSVPFFEFGDIIFFPKKYKRKVSQYRELYLSLLDE